jgi:hypothetical protein
MTQSHCVEGCTCTCTRLTRQRATRIRQDFVCVFKSDVGKLTIEANCKGKLPIWAIGEGGGAAAATAGATVSADGFVYGGTTCKIDGSTCVPIDCGGPKVAMDTCVNTVACYVLGKNPRIKFRLVSLEEPALLPYASGTVMADV